jgi:ribosomal protein S12 methylthiotransferase
MTINIITLGCSKNLVDSERLMRQFRQNQFTVYHEAREGDFDTVILNTCGFILDAKEESINAILEYIELKKSGKLGKLIVMGCLSERYLSELKEEMPEVDAFFGVWDHQKIVEAVGGRFFPDVFTDRSITTPSHYAYLKIAEGCNRQCSFCAIPGIRGKQRSLSIDDLVQEAKNLSHRGVRELILIAQDLTSYGVDLTGKHELARLLKEISKIESIDWLRLHYAYPSGFPAQVIEEMASNPKICNYLDIPVQHINDRILKSMNRGHNRQKLESLLKDFRSTVPDVALRTTLLVGYPGETEEEFSELLDFVKEYRFDRLGVFPYSHEDDTPAAALVDDVPPGVKTERVDRLMEVQQQISLELNESRVGKCYKVLVDSEEEDYYIARTEYDSPEVDNEVLIEKSEVLEIGTFYEVEITDASEFDLVGVVNSK